MWVTMCHFLPCLRGEGSTHLLPGAGYLRQQLSPEEPKPEETEDRVRPQAPCHACTLAVQAWSLLSHSYQGFGWEEFAHPACCGACAAWGFGMGLLFLLPTACPGPSSGGFWALLWGVLERHCRLLGSDRKFWTTAMAQNPTFSPQSIPPGATAKHLCLSITAGEAVISWSRCPLHLCLEKIL